MSRSSTRTADSCSRRWSDFTAAGPSMAHSSPLPFARLPVCREAPSASAGNTRRHPFGPRGVVRHSTRTPVARAPGGMLHARARHPADPGFAGLRRLVRTRPGCYTPGLGILPTRASPASAGWSAPGPPGLTRNAKRGVMMPIARLPVCPFARLPVCPFARLPVCREAPSASAGNTRRHPFGPRGVVRHSTRTPVARAPGFLTGGIAPAAPPPHPRRLRRFRPRRPDTFGPP
jgi:hypothetical protein